MTPAQPLFSQPTFQNLVMLETNNASENVWVSKRWVSRQEEFLKDAILGKSPRPHSFGDFIQFAHNPIDVIDYGGGSGWLMHSLVSGNFNVNSYINVESVDLHNVCNHNHSNYIHLHPSDLEMNNWESENSVLYLNSVIQYFGSDYALLDLVNLINPKYILIDDVTPSKFKEFFAYQKYYETRIAYRFLDKSQLIDLMQSKSFFLINEIAFSRVITSSFSYDFEQQDSKFQIGKTVSLLFQRNAGI